MNSKRSRILLKVISLLCLLGLLTSFYLIYTHYTAQGNCGIIAGEGCSIADSSIYSKIFGIPVAFFGALWFAFSFALILQTLRGNREIVGTLLIWEIIGLIAIGYFVRAEYKLNTICSLCTIVHVLILLSFILTVLMYALSKDKPPLKPHLNLKR